MKIKAIIFLFLVFISMDILASNDIKNSIVKVHVGKIYNGEEERLYTKGEYVYYEGTGLILNSKEILTSANLVKDASWISINKENQKKWYKMKVKKISDETSLALIEFQDIEKLQNYSPVKFAGNINKGIEISFFTFKKGSNSIYQNNYTISEIKRIEKSFNNIKYPIIQINKNLNHMINGAVITNNKNELVGIGIHSSEFFTVKTYIIPFYLLNKFLYN